MDTSGFRIETSGWLVGLTKVTEVAGRYNLPMNGGNQRYSPV